MEIAGLRLHVLRVREQPLGPLTLNTSCGEKAISIADIPALSRAGLAAAAGQAGLACAAGAERWRLGASREAGTPRRV